MVCRRTIGPLLAVFLASSATAASPPAPSPEEAAQLEGRICAQICRQRFEACAKSGLAADIKAATCETDVIVCTVNCPTCVGAFAKCTRDKGAAGTDKGSAGTDKGAASTDKGAASTDKGAASTDKGAGAVQACKAPFSGCMRGAVANGASSRPLIRFAGDGATRETAVVVTGALGEDEGIVAEQVWSGKTHPAWRKETQELIQAGGKAYDKIGYTASDGVHVAWFDITGFFGKR